MKLRLRDFGICVVILGSAHFIAWTLLGNSGGWFMFIGWCAGITAANVMRSAE